MGRARSVGSMLGSERTALAIGLLAVVVMAMAVAATGISQSRDSRSYLDVAEDLIDGRGFEDPTFEDAAHFPPGTAIAIAGPRALGASGTQAFLLVNVLAWLAVVAGAWRLYLDVGGPPGAPLVGLLLWVAVGGASVAVFSSALSEGLYLALLVWALVAAERWLATGDRAAAVATWALLAALVGTRYLGVAVLGGLALRATHGAGSARIGAARAAWIGSAVVPVALWWLAYRDVAGASPSVIRDRPVGLGAAAHSLAAAGATVLGIPYAEDELVSAAIDLPLRIVAVGVALAVLVGLGWALAGAGRPATFRARLAERGALGAVDASIAAVALLVAWRMAIGYHVLARYWLSALLPLLIVAVALLSARARRDELPHRWAVAIGVVAAGVLAANLLTSAYVLVS